MNTKIRTLIVDDSEQAREFIRVYLQREPRIEVLGAAHDGHQGVEMESRLKPDLVVMDIHMPAMDGLQATRLIKARPDAPRLIVVSFDDDDHRRSAARAAGADGFCSKSQIASTLMPMIRGLFPEPPPAKQ